jgi:tRNA/tmRNA/rRNA uracil-C5-methylase (TrmA/RlmC/RlmD family)
MHLSTATQHEVKVRIAGDALRRIGKRKVDDPPMVAAPHPLGYRSKVTLAVRDGRIGYHVLGRPDEVFDVRRCLIAEPRVQELIDGMRSARRHLPRDATRLVLRRDRNNGLHVAVRTATTQVWSGARSLHADLAGQGLAVTVWWHPEDGAPRAMAGSDDPWPATVFEQVHPAMGDRVRADAVAALGDLAGKHAWDLYAGVGDTTTLLINAGATVDSVERDRRAVAAAGPPASAGVVRHAGTAEEAVGNLGPPDVIITNPPRTGMADEVVTAIAATAVQRVAYISCDPATLARDVARLGDGFVLRELRAYDQFPQTSHLECLAVLERA